MTRTTVVRTATRSIPAKLTHKTVYKTKAALWPQHKYPVRTIQFGANRVLTQIFAHLSISPKPIPSEPISSEPMAAVFIPQQMRVLGLNHFNITASPAFIEQLKNFYVDVIGLTIGPRARLDHSGFWLYAGESSILHLSARQQSNCHSSTCQQSTCGTPAEKESAEEEIPLIEGCFNHISLSCIGLAATIEKLTALAIPYKIAEVPDFGQTQIFIKDPAGIGVELTFFE